MSKTENTKVKTQKSSVLSIEHKTYVNKTQCQIYASVLHKYITWRITIVLFFFLFYSYFIFIYNFYSILFYFLFVMHVVVLLILWRFNYNILSEKSIIFLWEICRLQNSMEKYTCHKAIPSHIIHKFHINPKKYCKVNKVL